jgi:hypothetical protein
VFRERGDEPYPFCPVRTEREQLTEGSIPRSAPAHFWWCVLPEEDAVAQNIDAYSSIHPPLEQLGLGVIDP